MAKPRHYYKITIHRYPPYSIVNGDYYMTRYIWAYSKEGARAGCEKRLTHAYGHNYVEDITEISKDEYYQHSWDDRLN